MRTTSHRGAHVKRTHNFFLRLSDACQIYANHIQEFIQSIYFPGSSQRKSRKTYVRKIIWQISFHSCIWAIWFQLAYRKTLTNFVFFFLFFSLPYLLFEREKNFRSRAGESGLFTFEAEEDRVAYLGESSSMNPTFFSMRILFGGDRLKIDRFVKEEHTPGVQNSSRMQRAARVVFALSLRNIFRENTMGIYSVATREETSWSRAPEKMQDHHAFTAHI